MKRGRFHATNNQRLRKKVVREQVEYLSEASEEVGAMRERTEILRAWKNLDTEAFQDWLYARCN